MQEEQCNCKGCIGKNLQPIMEFSKPPFLQYGIAEKNEIVEKKLAT